MCKRGLLRINFKNTHTTFSKYISLFIFQSESGFKITVRYVAVILLVIIVCYI